MGPVGPPQNVIVSDIAPIQDENGDPIEEGDLWWNSSDGNLYIYYVDDTGPQWVSCTKSGKMEMALCTHSMLPSTN